MRNFLKKNYKFLILFVFAFLVITFFGYNNTDVIWNYGFSHAIRMGEVPYRDFNIISTPLYAFLMSIGLFIYDDYIVFVLEQALLCTLLFYLFSKMVPKRTIVLLFVFSFPVFFAFLPNYNFLVLFLIILLIYLDNNDKDDYLIGFVLGLLILSKHTIGGCIFICSIISTFSVNKAIKRFLGTIVPLVVFVVYLLLTKSFYDFLNLSILGIFDFGSNNNYISTFYLILLCLVIGYLIYLFISDKKNKNNYYLLGSISFIIPICDYFHFNYLLIILIVVVLYKHTGVKYLKELCITLLVFTLGLNFFLNVSIFKEIQFTEINHFKGYLSTKSFNKFLTATDKKYKQEDNNYMFSFYNMFFDISTDKKITYFDVPLYGNFGYDGINNMKERIDKMHDVYFYVSDDDNVQYAKEIYDYIKNNSEFVETYLGIDIYYKK